MIPPDPKQTNIVSSAIIRQIFNSSNYYEKVLSGEFSTSIKKRRHLDPSKPPHEPYCTHSEALVYIDENGKVVAIVHQYKRPNGAIGASGKPDPKYLIYGGKKYTVKNE